MWSFSHLLTIREDARLLTHRLHEEAVINDISKGDYVKFYVRRYRSPILWYAGSGHNLFGTT